MVLEEEHQKCSNSSSGVGGRLSKKLKQKKIPQRGLGVAQLEKIRLEEQQKKDPAQFPVPCTHHYHQSSSSSTPFPPPCTTNQSSSNSLFRPTPSVSNFDLFNPQTPTNPLGSIGGGGGGDASVMGMSGMNLPGHSYIPTMWNPLDFNRDGDGTKMDPGLVYRPHLPIYSNPISTLPAVMQRNQYQYQPPSMVNVCSSTSSSSGLNFQMEPPSNQNNSNYIPLRPDEEKMVGIKRPYPFSLDSSPGPSIHFKLAPSVPSVGGWDESSPYGSGGRFNLEAERAIFREGSSCPIWSRGMSELNPEKGAKENGALDLTLGPVSTFSPSTSKSKLHSAFPASHYHYGDLQQLLPFQKGSIEIPLLQPVPVPVRSAPQQPFYNFLPSKLQIGQQTTSSNDGTGEAVDTIDLDLKLGCGIGK
ncbi:hypothetical protein HHK36_005073 [Tetracentron sinense]|uniref:SPOROCYTELESS-like EAR-containing protein 2 n=1 Tax=Tetracentron sinense TaxID=13715 RepID=A0A834ZMH7_TETSI|nr:hypothetical protein HHK36_005073 [Tetracentron sinense]